VEGRATFDRAKDFAGCENPRGEGQLRLAAVVDRQALEEERAESGAGATADGVEDEEALEAGAVVRELANAVEHQVDDLLADGVVAAGVVVGGVLLTRDKVVRTEQLSVRACPDLVHHRRLTVVKDAPRDMVTA